MLYRSCKEQALLFTNFYETNISELSSSIGHLVSLEKLHLRGTKVESLPSIIKNF